MSVPNAPDTDRHPRKLTQTPVGLLALQSLPGVGPAKALSAGLLASNFEALIAQHAAEWERALETAHTELAEPPGMA